MTRAKAIAHALDYFDTGSFKSDLSRLIAMPTESQNPDRAPVLTEYLEKEMQPLLESLAFDALREEEGALGLGVVQRPAGEAEALQ